MRALISRQQNCFFVKHTVPKDQFKAQASGSTLDLIYEILSLLAHTHTQTWTNVYTQKDVLFRHNRSAVLGRAPTGAGLGGACGFGGGRGGSGSWHWVWATSSFISQQTKEKKRQVNPTEPSELQTIPTCPKQILSHHKNNKKGGNAAAPQNINDRRNDQTYLLRGTISTQF